MHIYVLGIKQQLIPHTKSITKSQIESKIITFIGSTIYSYFLIYHNGVVHLFSTAGFFIRCSSKYVFSKCKQIIFNNCIVTGSMVVLLLFNVMNYA